MGRRLVPAALLVLLLVLQGQLWFGQRSNADAAQANARLEAEIRDLREGLEMVEEKARSELGMVKPNEIFVQVTK